MKTAFRTAPALAVVALVATATAVVLAATPTSAAAQDSPVADLDCGKECHTCGPSDWGREGTRFGGSYEMGCIGGDLCNVC